MARKPQINLNVPDEVYEWFTLMERELEKSKTRLGLAGFVLLRTTDQRTKAEALALGYMLDRGFIGWTEVEEYAEFEGMERSGYVTRLCVGHGVSSPPEPRAVRTVKHVGKRRASSPKRQREA